MEQVVEKKSGEGMKGKKSWSYSRLLQLIAKDSKSHGIAIIFVLSLIATSIPILTSGLYRIESHSTYLIHLFYDYIFMFTVFGLIMACGYISYRCYALKIEDSELRKKIYAKWLEERNKRMKVLMKSVADESNYVKEQKNRQKKLDEANNIVNKSTEEEEHFENANADP